MTAPVVSLRLDGTVARLTSEFSHRADGIAERTGADGLAPDLTATLALTREFGRRLPVPGRGQTLLLWEVLATAGAIDLTIARVLEPHADAMAILAQAADGPQAPAEPEDDGVFGVYAAEGPGGRLRARREPDGRWRLDGSKPWCSLADQMEHALVTAWVADDQRQLFLVDLDERGVHPDDPEQSPWAARGLVQIRSAGVRFDDVPAEPCGEPGWYLERPGFAWGGAGVAAVWFGAAVALGRRLHAAAQRRTPDQIALAHLGAVDVALCRAHAMLIETAALADREPPSAVADRAAMQVRQVVADAAAEVLNRVGCSLGPGPLTSDERHARRVADLTVYIRQHHAERDQARLGGLLLGDGVPERAAAAVGTGSADTGWRWW